MAELYQVYGHDDFSEDPSPVNNKQPITSHIPPRNQEPPRSQEPSPPQLKKEHFQDFTNVVQEQPPAQQYVKKYNPTYSFWDRLSLKRPEVMKLAIFSLVILLAISLERIGTHYINKYLADNVLTDFQEFMIRLSYPVIVFLLLWVFKSL